MEEYKAFLLQYDKFIDKISDYLINEKISYSAPKGIECDFEEGGVHVTFNDGAYDLRESAFVPVEKLIKGDS